MKIFVNRYLSRVRRYFSFVDIMFVASIGSLLWHIYIGSINHLVTAIVIIVCYGLAKLSSRHLYHTDTVDTASCLDQLPISVVVTDLKGNVIYVDKSFEGLTGYAAVEMMGHPISILRSGHHESEYYQDLWKTVSRDGMWRGDIHNRRKDGNFYWASLSIKPYIDTEGKIIGYISVQENIDARRKEYDTVKRMANKDGLTGLCLRSELMNRLKSAVEFSVMDTKFKFALMFLDLDKFKPINDNFGHLVGDEVLKVATSRINSCLRKKSFSEDRLNDEVFRYGGDEFAVLLNGINNQNDIEDIARRILKLIAEPIKINENCSVNIGTSIGLAMGSNTPPDQIIKKADNAMYAAKKIGNCFRWYSDDMDHQDKARFRLEQDLRNALGRNEFSIAYQPIVDLADGVIIGAESLLRWDHPSLGQILPGKFLTLMEDSGLIIPIGEWMFDQVCMQAKFWRELIYVSFNVSAKQLRSPGFEAMIARGLKKYGLPAHCISIEVTDKLEFADADLRILRDLEELGIRVALDDFGPGHVNLEFFINGFHASEIKISKDFCQVETLSLAELLLKAAEQNDKKAVITGIEDEEMLALIKQIGFTKGQGYFLYKPMSATEMTELLEPSLEHCPDCDYKFS